MPVVVTEGGTAEALQGAPVAPPRRSRERIWLAFLGLVLALMIGVPIIPLVRPVKVQAGVHMVVIGTTVLSPGSSNAPPPQGFSALVEPGSGMLEDLELVQYLAQGPTHVYALRVKDWIYYLWWFRGHRR